MPGLAPSYNLQGDGTNESGDLQGGGVARVIHNDVTRLVQDAKATNFGSEHRRINRIGVKCKKINYTRASDTMGSEDIYTNFTMGEVLDCVFA